MKSLKVLRTRIGWVIKFQKLASGLQWYIYSGCLVRVIYTHDEAIERIRKIVQNYSKGITILSSTMVYMEQDLNNQHKEMEYYASKLHQMDKQV